MSPPEMRPSIRRFLWLWLRYALVFACVIAAGLAYKGAVPTRWDPQAFKEIGTWMLAALFPITLLALAQTLAPEVGDE